MFSRNLQDLSSRSLQDISSRRLQDVFKTPCEVPSRRLGRRKIVTLKTYQRRLQDMSWRRLEDQQMFVGLVMALLSCNRSSTISRDIGDRVNRRNIKNMTSGFFFKIGIMWWLVSAKVAPLKSCTFAKRSLLNLAIDSSDNRVPYCNAGTNQPRMFNLLRGEVIYCTIFIRYLTSLLTVFWIRLNWHFSRL